VFCLLILYARIRSKTRFRIFSMCVVFLLDQNTDVAMSGGSSFYMIPPFTLILPNFICPLPLCLLTVWTDSRGQNHSCEGGSRSAGQKFLRLLSNPKVSKISFETFLFPRVVDGHGDDTDRKGAQCRIVARGIQSIFNISAKVWSDAPY
jgi:hypothetical protein